MPEHIDGLYTLRPIDMPQAASVFADAFRSDPIWHKVFADVTRFADRYRAHFEMGIRLCLRFGGAYAPSRRLEGVAGWLPARHADLTPLRSLMSGTTLGWLFLRSLRIGMGPLERMMPMGAVLSAHRKRHMAGREHRYLQMIGVATRHQGAGLGSGMVRALCAHCDREGTWLYLETATERNARFYERLDFSVLDEIVVPGLELPMWELARAPT